MTVTRRGRRLIRTVLGGVAVLALALVGWMWLRDSSFVAVRNVEITGVTASEGDRVRTALEATALEMTTLHVRREALREATANFTSVKDIHVKTDFPHGMTIEVTERQPVAALAFKGEQRIPVTGDGVVMRGVVAERDLPSLAVKDPIGPRVTDRRALRALTVAGAAPSELLRRSGEVRISGKGVVVTLTNGPELVFGSAAEARSKWLAAARVLAETSAAGATYLDLRIPGRVAAGGLAPLDPPQQDPNPQPEAENGPTLDG